MNGIDDYLRINAILEEKAHLLFVFVKFYRFLFGHSKQNYIIFRKATRNAYFWLTVAAIKT